MAEQGKIIPFNDEVRKRIEAEQQARRIQERARELQRKMNRTATVGQLMQLSTKIEQLRELMDCASACVAINSIMMRRGWFGRLLFRAPTLKRVRAEINRMQKAYDKLSGEAKKEMETEKAKKAAAPKLNIVEKGANQPPAGSAQK